MSAHVTEDLTALLDGELAETDRARIQEHLAACPACTAERTALETALGRVSAVVPIEPSADLRRRVLNALDAEPEGLLARFRALFSSRFLVPAAAASAAALMLVFATAKSRPESGLEDLDVAERLDLLKDYDVVAAAPVGVDPDDLEVVASLHELGE